MSSTPVNLALDNRRKLIDSWAHAAVVSAIAVLWFCPLLLFWCAVWDDGQPFSLVGCALSLSVGLLAMALPSGYYRPRSWEASGRAYRRLGVRWFSAGRPMAIMSFGQCGDISPTIEISAVARA